MSNLSDEIKEMFKALAGAWASYTALGTFLLYLTGYLSLRFHLTVLGIGTDIALIDERYLYAGAKFWVYIVLYIPVIILLLLALFILIAILLSVLKVISFIIFRLSSKRLLDIHKVKQGAIWLKIRQQSNNPNFIALLGILFSALVIQLLMRQCLFLNNLLLNPNIPDAVWIGAILKDVTIEVMFFSAILTGTAITGALLFSGWRQYKKECSEKLLKMQSADALPLLLLSLLTLLFIIQFLLLPINHGVLIADKAMPKVKDLGGLEALSTEQQAWLIWEGSETLTYFIESNSPDNTSDKPNIQRKLLTLPKKESKRIEIIGYEKILGK